jgi:hypothetical protein
MSLLKINQASLKDIPVKTTPQNVQESNEALFNCTMTLPAAAKLSRQMASLSLDFLTNSTVCVAPSCK